MVHAIDIAGRPDKNNHFVKSFTLFYSLNGCDWTAYKNEQVLQGNSDTADVVRHDLEEFKALAVRICPKEWHG